MNLPTDSSSGYQILDRSQQPVTRWLTDETTHGTIKIGCWKNDHFSNALYEVELAKAQIERIQLIINNFFLLQVAELRMVELYYKLFTKICCRKNFEESIKGTDFVHIALAEKNLENCNRPEMKAERQRLRSKGCIDSSTAKPVGSFFLWTCSVKHRKETSSAKSRAWSFQRSFQLWNMLSSCCKSYFRYGVTSSKFKLSIEGLSKPVLEKTGDGTLETHCLLLDQKVNFTSTNTSFLTSNLAVVTYKQIRIGLSRDVSRKKYTECWSSHSASNFLVSLAVQFTFLWCLFAFTLSN